MVFFKKYKTSWRHVLIVVIAALFVGGGILLYLYGNTPGDESQLPRGGKIPADGKVEPIITDDSGRVVVEEINYPSEFKGVLMELHIVDNQITLLSEPEIVDGYPNYLPGAYDYLARIISTSEEILGEYGFDEQRRIQGEMGYQGPTWLEELDFTLILPYFKNSSRIDIFSTTDLMLSIGLEKNPQVKCLGSCNCMEKCNEEGPTYFIPVKEGSSECSVNSVNKICCCSGI